MDSCAQPCNLIVYYASVLIDLLLKATQEVISFVPQATDDELKMAIESSAEAFKTWKKTSIMSRQAKMFALQHLIRRDMDKIGAIITEELGKTQADAKGDVLRGLRKHLLFWEIA